MPLPSNLTEEFHVSSQAEWKPIEKGSDTGNETNLKAFHSKIHRFTCKESSQLVPAGLLNKGLLSSAYHSQPSPSCLGNHKNEIREAMLFRTVSQDGTVR